MKISTNETIGGTGREESGGGGGGSKRPGKAGRRARGRSRRLFRTDWSELLVEDDLRTRATKISTQEMSRCLVPQLPVLWTEHRIKSHAGDEHLGMYRSRFSRCWSYSGAGR